VAVLPAKSGVVHCKKKYLQQLSLSALECASGDGTAEGIKSTPVSGWLE
jgi:hypothetical protein